MASSEQVKKFINEIAPLAQKAYLELGKIHPSICIGMACVESAYGTAGSCKYHSYLGQKVGTGKTATKYWKGTFFTAKTKEEYTVGTHTVIKAAFRAYPSMELCVFNYYELLNSSVYKKVTKTQYREQMQQIKDCGYMTSSTECSSVLNIIAKYNLTQYDLDDSGSAAVNPYKIPTVTLKKGSKGSSVKWLQYEINRILGLTLVIDGSFGNCTLAAVLTLQKKLNLVQDGKVGPATRKAITEYQ
ncbi:MAG: peptidoglycan-binding protein [Clostridiales bacterium]|nr:peptidoglycan-binding protein [Clostridiales bacterium]